MGVPSPPSPPPLCLGGRCLPGGAWPESPAPRTALAVSLLSGSPIPRDTSVRPEWQAGGDAGLPRGWGSASAGTRSPSDSCSEALTGLLRLTPALPPLPRPRPEPACARDSRVHAQHHDVLPQVPGSHHLHDADLLGPPGKLLLQLCREGGPVSHARPGSPPDGPMRGFGGQEKESVSL